MYVNLRFMQHVLQTRLQTIISLVKNKPIVYDSFHIIAT